MRRVSKKRMDEKHLLDEINRRRKETGDKLIFDRRRAGRFMAPCEGTAFVPHKCNGPLELNEVIYQRNIFQKLPPSEWPPFFAEWNMSVNCRFFHATYGHRKAFRDWFLKRMVSIYGIETLQEWSEALPVKEEDRVVIE